MKKMIAENLEDYLAEKLSNKSYKIIQDVAAKKIADELADKRKEEKAEKKEKKEDAVTESLNTKPVQNFTRGGNPYMKLGIGRQMEIAQEATSEDLNSIALGEGRQREIMEEEGIEQDEIERVVQRHNVLADALEPYVEWGPSFDWKQEDGLQDYIRKHAHDRYAYNYSYGSDDASVLFSTIELPKAITLCY